MDVYTEYSNYYHFRSKLKMGSWTMFLDATRSPMYGAIAVRSIHDAKTECLRRGAPNHLVMEYYMGHSILTGLDFVEWLIKLDRDWNGTFIPPHFTFYVHSQNTEGKEKIEKALYGYLEERRQNNLQEQHTVERLERRDRRNSSVVPKFLDRRSKSSPKILWGNLSGSDYAFHTRNKLLIDRRKVK